MQKRVLRIKIRGIYATALTRFFLDRGYRILDPSDEVARRFSDTRFIAGEKPDLIISDLQSLQGVIIAGEEAAVLAAGEHLRESFLDAVFRNPGYNACECIEVEFPCLTKSGLDDVRHRVLPTAVNHHRYRIIGGDHLLNLLEKDLTDRDEDRERISRQLKQRLIWNTYHPGKTIGIEHVKPDGHLIRLSEGKIVALDAASHRLVLERPKFKSGGRYDGLDIAKEDGDYALTDVVEGSWSYTHSYYRHDGSPIGKYCNVNTPIEFYPEKIRYVDLEIDVVVRPEGQVDIIDRSDLFRRLKAGNLNTPLVKKAQQTAWDLKSRELPE